MSRLMPGWVRDDRAVAKVWESMPTPFFATPAPDDKDAFNHLIFRDYTGAWHDEGPQKIGDCVSWGNSRLVDYTCVLEAASLSVPDAYVFEKTATEVLYALSRIDVGKGQIRGDGSVGAWAAEAITKFGTISRKRLDELGVGGTYSGDRARQWGSQGLPSNLHPEAALHTVEDATPVKTFNEFAWHAQQGRVTAVCSNVGFENGSNGTTQRDSEGFATPSGEWGHCMTLVSVRMGKRPGGLLCNQWPPGVVVGPNGPCDIPPCSWWVDAHVIDGMLAQNDSFTATKYKGYPARKLTWRF